MTEGQAQLRNYSQMPQMEPGVREKGKRKENWCNTWKEEVSGLALRKLSKLTVADESN